MLIAEATEGGYNLITKRLDVSPRNKTVINIHGNLELLRPFVKLEDCYKRVIAHELTLSLQ